MQMLYNSDSFAVVRFELPALQRSGDADDGAAAATRGGFEIVDKTAKREIFIEGALAERFQRGVQEIVEAGSASEETFDDYIAGFARLAQQPLVLH
jgi:hypothetical protein